MAAKITGLPIFDTFRQADQKYQNVKAQLSTWATKLGGNVTLVDGINILQSVNQTITQLQAFALASNLNLAAQAAYQDPTLDAVAILNTMITDLQAISAWITTNLPNTTYTPAQTAPLLALIQTAITDAA